MGPSPFPAHKNNNSKGFSLLEVMIALSILSFLALVVSSSWSGNFLRVRKSKINSNVAQLLERKAIEIETQYTGLPLAEVPKQKSGNFGSEFKQYRWTMSSREFEMPDLSSLLASREEGADENLIQVRQKTSEFISKSVKEVKVSVFFKHPGAKKEREYSITMYMVDYSQELTL